MFLGIRNALRSIKNKCVTCRNGRVHTIAQLIADLLEAGLNFSTSFRIVDVECVDPFNVDMR